MQTCPSPRSDRRLLGLPPMRRTIAVVVLATTSFLVPTATPFRQPPMRRAVRRANPTPLSLPKPRNASLHPGGVDSGDHARSRAVGDRACRLAQRRDEVDAAHARDMGYASRSLRPWALTRSIPTTTSWRARLFLREMHDRYGSPGFIAAYNAGPGRYEDYLATAIVRCRRRPSPTWLHSFLFVGDGATDGSVLVAASDRVVPGHRRRHSSCDRQTLNLSIARQPNRPRTTSHLRSRCAICRPSHRNPMGCSSTFPQRGRSSDRTILPSICR